MIKLRGKTLSDTFTLHDGEYSYYFHHDDGRMRYGGWLCSSPDVVLVTRSLVIEDGKPHFTGDSDAYCGLVNRKVSHFHADTRKDRVSLIRLGSRVQYLASITEINELLDRGILRPHLSGSFTKQGFVPKTT